MVKHPVRIVEVHGMVVSTRNVTKFEIDGVGGPKPARSRSFALYAALCQDCARGNPISMPIPQPRARMSN